MVGGDVYSLKKFGNEEMEKKNKILSTSFGERGDMSKFINYG